MIIAFSGSSGSGKSTLINQVKKNKYFKDKKVIVKKEDDFVAIKIAKSIFGEKLFLDYKEDKFFPKKNNSKSEIFSGLVHIFYPLVIYLEFILDHILYEGIFKSRILIKDKYIYSYLITFKDILKIDSAFVRSLYSRFPKPHLIFYMDISLQTSLKRNKNKVKGKITSQRSFHSRIIKSYKKLANSVGMIKINTDNNLKTSLKNTVECIVNKDKLLKVSAISISGLDGSGKSTFASLFCKHVNDLGIKCKQVHFFHDNLVYKLFKRIGKEKSKVLTKAATFKDRKPLFWAFVTFTDSYIQYLYSMLTRKGGIVVFDRFFYDYLVSFGCMGIRSAPLYAKFIPTIDRKFLFLINPTLAHRRKPENTLKYFKQAGSDYLDVAREQDLIKIEVGNKSKAAILEEVIDNI